MLNWIIKSSLHNRVLVLIAALLVSVYGVYVTLNPLNPDLMARRANRIDRADEGDLAKDKDVLVERDGLRSWFLYGQQGGESISGVGIFALIEPEPFVGIVNNIVRPCIYSTRYVQIRPCCTRGLERLLDVNKVPVVLQEERNLL